MTGEKIHASEEEFLVFISSRQDEEMCRARDLAIETVDKFPVTRVWAIEDAPASSESPRDRYLRNAGRADFVIWLIGSSTTTPVFEEVVACLDANGRLLPFMLPAQERDAQTQELIERVKGISTWREVEDVEALPEHIKAALADEVLRAARDPAPINHDQYLDQEHRDSIAETKGLWTTLGVDDDLAHDLANDQSVGHELNLPISGLFLVYATQGSGKTLAAHRLYQKAIENRLENHLEPLPLFLNARSINGEVKDYIKKAVGDQGNLYTQRILVVVDGLDELGGHEANQLLGSIESIVDAGLDIAAVVMTRPLPGLKNLDGSTALPDCSDEQFLSIASRVAGRPIRIFEIPYQVSRTKTPLFAVIVGTHFRDSRNPLGSSPSQIISQLVKRVLERTGDISEEVADPLKKLAVECINSGESVSKATVDRRASVHALLARSRLVVEKDDRVDFALAIFREWFAARAIVEGAVSPSDIDFGTDRWVVPLAIAINSENESLGPEVMEVVSTGDPGLASQVLEEVKYNWSLEETPEQLPDGTAFELGLRIRQAMLNWSEGLGPLMTAIGPISRSGEISTLAIAKRDRMVTTCWYGGEEQLDPVVDIPMGLNPLSYEHGKNWPRWRSSVIEPTRVWPWTATKEELSSSLSELLDTYCFALDSTIGFREYATALAKSVTSNPLTESRAPRTSDLIDWIGDRITMLGRGPGNSIIVGQQRFTVKELELVRDRLLELQRSIGDTTLEPWPGQDKPWPGGRTAVKWYELYSERQLLERTKAIFDGALRIYNDIVEQWFRAFNRRHQMSYMLPLRLEGVLNINVATNGRERSNATLLWWPRLVDSHAESGVYFELGPDRQFLGPDTKEKLKAAEDEFLLHIGRFWQTEQALPGNEPRPATELAHDWLAKDLTDLRWL